MKLIDDCEPLAILINEFIDQALVWYLDKMHFNYDMRDHTNLKEINATNRERNALFQLNTSLLSYVYYA